MGARCGYLHEAQLAKDAVELQASSLREQLWEREEKNRLLEDRLADNTSYLNWALQELGWAEDVEL